MSMPHHRYGPTPFGLALLGCVLFWVVVGMIIAHFL